MLKSPVYFLFKGKDHLSTKPGFFLSLILFVFLLNTVIKSDLFYQKKPIINFQTDPNEHYGQMVFDRSNFTIITKIANFKGVSIIDYSYYYFNMTFNHYDISAEIALENKKFMRMCEPKDFTQKELALNLSMKTFCISQEEQMILKGSTTTGTAEYAILSLNRCDKYSAAHYNTTCKNKNEIDDFLRNKFL